MTPRKESPGGFQPRPSALATLVALGVASALLALFLWSELLLARAGGSTLCGLGDPGGCARLWDGAVAAGVHRATGVPIAGWGLVWALAATALPLLALMRAAAGRPQAAWLTAVRLTAAGGVAGVFALAAVAAQARTLCLGCLLTYALVLGYAGIALVGWRALGLPERGAALRLALGALAVAFAVVLYPGLQTPSSRAIAGSDAVAGAGSALAAPPAPGANDAVSRFVASLAPAHRQSLADSLYIYRTSIALPVEPARALIGPPSAPLRITEFTDIRCGACADLHKTLAALEREAPAGSFSVEPRYFPLDAECNPYIQRASDPVRCLAAQAQICVEGRAGSPGYASALFSRQDALTVDEVYALAAELMPRPALEACVRSAATAIKLRADIDLAVRYQLDGTPLVLLNGRKGTSFPPFLYAMALAGGRADHPAFASLPPANPNAHIH